MLRRFFISILILSALASEGMVNLPVNIYNMYINSGSQFGVSGGVAASADQTVLPQSNFTAARSLESGGVCFLTQNSIEKFNLLYAVNDSDSRYIPQYPYLSANPIYISFIKYDKNVLIKRSDLSPPYLA